MKDNTVKLANAFALAIAILWTLCSVVVWLLPEFSWQVTTWWMHGMDMSALGKWQLTINNFIMGGIAAIVSAWVTGWILAWSWQQVGGNKKK